MDKTAVAACSSQGKLKLKQKKKKKKTTVFQASASQQGSPLVPIMAKIFQSA